MEEKRGRNRRKGKRERERKEDLVASSSNFRHSDGQSSSGQELKFIYSTRATLQEIGILPTLVFFSTLRGLVFSIDFGTEILD